uniref:Uncharacterized protein n=1 Tax=Arundo donax TaxID=35708 RepID=A0A0A9DVV4_ARUDO
MTPLTSPSSTFLYNRPWSPSNPHNQNIPQLIFPQPLYLGSR